MSERKIFVADGELSIYENEIGSISISDGDTWVLFDECCAEKVCKYIMEVAMQIRGKNDENELCEDK